MNSRLRFTIKWTRLHRVWVCGGHRNTVSKSTSFTHAQHNDQTKTNPNGHVHVHRPIQATWPANVVARRPSTKTRPRLPQVELFRELLPSPGMSLRESLFRPKECYQLPRASATFSLRCFSVIFKKYVLIKRLEGWLAVLSRTRQAKFQAHASAISFTMKLAGQVANFESFLMMVVEPNFGNCFTLLLNVKRCCQNPYQLVRN